MKRIQNLLLFILLITMLAACGKKTDPGERPPATPTPLVALPCGSRSTSSVEYPEKPSAAAVLTADVVLPTPPF